MNTVISEAEGRMKKSVKALGDDLNQVRTGRASATIFDKLKIDYYGTPTPLNQVASIAIPEARQIVISPFDKNSLSDIEKAIQTSELSLNPNNDGKVIRINIPPLTEDSRKDLVKQVKAIGEKSRVSIRNIRRDANDTVKKGDFTEDEQKKGNDDIQKKTDKYIVEIGKIIDAKEKEIMEV